MQNGVHLTDAYGSHLLNNTFIKTELMLKHYIQFPYVVLMPFVQYSFQAGKNTRSKFSDTLFTISIKE
jgi:hypothetical protein